MNFFNDVKNTFSHAPNQIRDAFNQAIDKIQQAAGGAINQISQTAHGVQEDIHKTAGDLTNNLHSVRDSIQGEVYSNIIRVGKDIENKLKGLESDFTNELKKVWHELEEDARKDVVKKSLRVLLDLIEKVPISSISQQISFLQFTIDNPGDKVKAIEEAIKSPPSTHKEIVDLIKELGAGSVTFILDFELFSSVVEEDTEIEISVEKAVDFVDYIEQEIEGLIK